MDSGIMKIIFFETINVTKNKGSSNCQLHESKGPFIPWKNSMCHNLLLNKDLWLPQVKGIADVLCHYTKIKLTSHTFWCHQSLWAFLTSWIKTDGVFFLLFFKFMAGHKVFKYTVIRQL